MAWWGQWLDMPPVLLMILLVVNWNHFLAFVVPSDPVKSSCCGAHFNMKSNWILTSTAKTGHMNHLMFSHSYIGERKKWCEMFELWVAKLNFLCRTGSGQGENLNNKYDKRHIVGAWWSFPSDGRKGLVSSSTRPSGKLGCPLLWLHFYPDIWACRIPKMVKAIHTRGLTLSISFGLILYCSVLWVQPLISGFLIEAGIKTKF